MSLPGPVSYDLFLAHAGADTAAAEKLFDLLAPDVRPWLDARSLLLGDEWPVEIPRAQRAALATVILVSSRAEHAYYLRDEIHTAIALHRSFPAEHRAVAVFLDGRPADPMQVPYGLRGLHSLDVMAEGGLEGIARRLKALVATLRERVASPAPAGVASPSVGAATPSPPAAASPLPAAAAPIDRVALYERLCKLTVGGQLDAVILRAELPREHIRPEAAPLAQRALDIVHLVEQRGPEAVARLENALAHQIAAHADPVAEWLQWGARKYGFIRVVGFHDKYKIRLPLHDVFVELSLQPRERTEPTSKARASDRAMLHADQPRNVQLDEALALADKLPGTAGIVLLGDPGAGKTTLLYHLYTRVAKDGSASTGLPEGLCPVYIRCSSITEQDRKPNGLKAVILREAEQCGYAEAGRRIVNGRSKVLFLLDGLDEVRDKATRAHVCDWLADETTHWPGSRFVVTCRYTAFRDEARLDNQFLRVDVQWLDERRVRDFVRRWYHAVEAGLHGPGMAEPAAERAAERAEALLKGVLDRERQRHLRLREMTENPLLLSTLCLVHHSDLRLPDKRGELYDRCLGLLFEAWAAHAERPTLPDKASRLVLQPLAYEMQVQAVRELPCAEVEALVAGPLADIPALPLAASEFLEIACEQCGVLASRNIDSYEFFHLSFQEYLAAAHIKETGLVPELAQYAGDPRWREVVLLAVSMPGVFGPLMRELIRTDRLAANADLVRACLDETIQLDAAPFLELLDRAVAQMDKPSEGLSDLVPAVCTVLELAQGRKLRGIAERADKLADNPDASIQAAARVLVGRPVVEQVTEQAPADAIWREPVTGMSFVWVPPGRFLMGSSKERGAPGFDRDAWEDEMPAHEVEMPHGVWMGEHPVTNAQYGAFVAATDYAGPRLWQSSEYNAAEQPVVGVSFNEALDFCAWLTERAGLQKGYCFDLPTEAEWEHAARGSDGRKYPWGNDGPTPERAWFGQQSRTEAPAPVGGRPAGKSPFECQDMAGNVWEWCLDAWKDGYHHMMTNLVNPCHSGDRGAPRVVRGGSWFDGYRGLRCAFRLRFLPWDRSGSLGFRVVCRGSRQPWLVGS